MTTDHCHACGVPWSTHLGCEGLCRANRNLVSQNDVTLTYATQLQQIIEALCRGGTMPHQHLSHGQMAAEFRKAKGTA